MFFSSRPMFIINSMKRTFVTFDVMHLWCHQAIK